MSMTHRIPPTLQPATGYTLYGLTIIPPGSRAGSRGPYMGINKKHEVAGAANFAMMNLLYQAKLDALCDHGAYVLYAQLCEHAEPVVVHSALAYAYRFGYITAGQTF